MYSYVILFFINKIGILFYFVAQHSDLSRRPACHGVA